jgi:hypothetical protein
MGSDMSWFRDLKIWTKLIIGFSAVAVLTAVVGVIGLRSIEALPGAWGLDVPAERPRDQRAE